MGAFTDEVLKTGEMEGPDRVAVVELHRTWTWRELRAAAHEASSALSRMGVSRLDRVLYLNDDSIKHQVLMMACADIGAILVPLNTKYTSGEVDQAVSMVRPVLVLTSPGYLERFVNLSHSGKWKPFPLEELVGSEVSDQGARNLRQLAPGSFTRTPFLICLTSGSTGTPKAVVYSTEGELSCVRMFGRLWRLNSRDAVLGALPFAWVYGLSTTYLTALVAGSVSIMVPRFSPKLVFEALKRNETSVFLGTSSQYRILLEYSKGNQDAQLGSLGLRMAIAGGERRNEAVLDEFTASTGTPVFDLYASSECRPAFGYDPLVDRLPRPNKCGRPVPGVEVDLRIAPGAAESDLPVLYARSPGNYMGYFDADKLVDPEATAETWINLGDAFSLDSAGYGQVHDRHTGLIIRGGTNISPAEVEHVLYSHPGVLEAVVVGMSDNEYGEAVSAAVVWSDAAGEFDPDALAAFCSERLSNYKVPTVWRRVSELPRNVNDKIDRRSITRSFKEAAQAQ